MKQLSAIAIAVSLILTGCGGSDSGDASSTGDSALQRQALDGYLVNAEVYVDRNSNNIAEDTEIIGTTDSQGKFAVSEQDAEFPLIVRAIAGISHDTDKGGRLTNTFEIAAPAGTAVVSPFSTIAVIENKTLEEVAAELNIDSTVLDADYVAAKQANDEAKQAHAIARSLTLQLDSDLASSEANISAIKTQLDNINSKIQDQINNNVDLDTIIVDKNGNVADAPKTVKSMMVGKTYYSVSTNDFYFRDEGVSKYTFHENKLSFIDDNGEVGEQALTYTDTGFITPDGKETIVLLGEKLSLTVTPQGDMFVASQENFADSGYQKRTLQRSEFAGKTLYHFWDDSTDENTDPDMAKIVLNDDGSGVIVERYGLDWSETEMQGTWHVSEQGDLVLQAADLGSDWVISFTTLSSQGVHVAYEDNRNQSKPLLFTENYELADNLYSEWLQLVK
jgi:hypothetical protein